MIKNLLWPKKRILATGGADLIGFHLVEILVNENTFVTVVDNLENRSLKNLNSVKDKIRFIKSDL